jgi:ABC-type transporter Mla maintaining outer membrane lipid asymmetry ATPase subunit MlaF
MTDRTREFDEHAMSRQEILDAVGAPVVVFDKVSLAFDDKVILREVSFTLIKGHTKIILGASGAGKSTILKLITGLLRPDSGVIWVNGERVDEMTELEMMRVRADLGMVFQEGALFDSLTVRENVGYKLYEQTDMSLEDIDRRVEEVLGFIDLGEQIDRCRRSCRAVSGAAWRSRARWPSNRASCCTTRRRPASIRSPR